MWGQISLKVIFMIDFNMHEYYQQLLLNKSFSVPEDMCIKIGVYITNIRSLWLLSFYLKQL